MSKMQWYTRPVITTVDLPWSKCSNLPVTPLAVREKRLLRQQEEEDTGVVLARYCICSSKGGSTGTTYFPLLQQKLGFLVLSKRAWQKEQVWLYCGGCQQVHQNFSREYSTNHSRLLKQLVCFVLQRQLLPMFYFLEEVQHMCSLLIFFSLPFAYSLAIVIFDVMKLTPFMFVSFQ